MTDNDGFETFVPNAADLWIEKKNAYCSTGIQLRWLVWKAACVWRRAQSSDEIESNREAITELLDAARYAREVLGILWVSHHASRTDAAIEQIDAAIAKHEPKP